MNGDTFLELCKDIVLKHSNEELGHDIKRSDVFIVWGCKTLQNNKALLSTSVKGALYYEITHSGDKNETYVDAYTKASKWTVR